ncbi:uncharacterized protein LOC132760349 [Ruditapes philippinarum]|uniref:uncharacterized protein LOC132760349 n=1 Tax=Ruditapes philippinarum TaxID=129788 RepID=UPI00295B8497|nr:uncharacterized protein LOC132760349 [Ruditapes philippinarum]
MNQVKGTFNNETFEIQEDAEKNVHIELLLVTGSFRTVLAIGGKDVYRQTFEEVLEENSNVCFTNETCSTDISDVTGADVVESHSADSTRANDPQCDNMCNKMYTEKDENSLSLYNEDKIFNFKIKDTGMINNVSDVYINKGVDYNGICDEPGSNDETEVLEPDKEINLSFDSSDSNANAFSVDDKDDSLLTEPSSFSQDPYHKVRNKKQKALSNETVDIRRNRTELLKTMRSDKLAEYFFEHSLISEDNLDEISEYVKKDNIWGANSYFLRILRNRRITKQKIEVVLSIAEEPHLLGLLFPIQSQFESASTQTDDL